MILKQLIEDTSWEEIKESLIKNYNFSERDINAHQYVFFRLFTLEPKENTMKICITFVPSSDNNEEGYWSVNGEDGTLQKESEDYNFFKENCTDEFANTPISYAIEFTPWNMWLGMDISSETINNIKLTKADIVAHCLNEMAFISYDEEKIQEKLSDLNDSVDKIKNMTDEELKKNTVTIDELMERLKDKIEDGR
jgi:hypothetical protein